MIKDILVLNQHGKELGIVSNDIGDGEEALINLIEVSMEEMPGKDTVLDVLYIQDMNYGVVIPKHIAKRLSDLLALELSPEDLESDIVSNLDEQCGVDTDGDHMVVSWREELDKRNKRMTGADVDGDMINGEYHNLILESEQQGITIGQLLDNINKKQGGNK